MTEFQYKYLWNIIRFGLKTEPDVNGKPFIPHGFKNEDEIMKLQRESYRRFYFRPSYILKKIININEFSRNIDGFKILLKLDR